MSETTSSAMMPLTIHLIGPFRLLCADGTDLSPRGTKARALLALLAVAPQRARSRAYLQDKLWSDRDAGQGRTSLRQTLHEIRKSLGACRDVVRSQGQVLTLVNVRSDLENLDDALPPQVTETTLPEFLEGVDIRDKEYEHWARDQRTMVRQQMLACLTMRKQAVAVQDASLTVEFLPSAAQSPNGIDTRSTVAADRDLGTSWLNVNATGVDGNAQGQFLADLVGDEVARCASDVVGADVLRSNRSAIDDPNRSQPEMEIAILGIERAGSIALQCRLIRPRSACHLWSQSRAIRSETAIDVHSDEIRSLVNQIVDAAICHDPRPRNTDVRESASGYCLQAIHKIFSAQASNLDDASTLLDQAYALEPRAVYLAWKAYLLNFVVGERHASDCAGAIDQAELLVREAIRSEPFNAQVLALCSHVHAFLLRDRLGAHELATRSVECDPTNVFGLTYLAAAKGYLGQHRDAYRVATAARRAAGVGPFRPTLEVISCFAAVMNGRVPEAIRLARAACMIAPDYRPPMRYLFALNLHEGRREEARRMFDRLRTVEPDFSLRLMRDDEYPCAYLRQSGLLPSRDAEFDAGN